MTRVLISNVYSDDNRGGAALTSAAISAVQANYPNADISLLTLIDDPARLAQSHRHTARDHPEVTLLPALLHTTGRAATARALATSLALLACPRPLLRRCRSLAPVLAADVVIGKGGQIFRSRDRAGLLAVWFAVWPLVMSSRVGIPCALYGQAFGPFRQPLAQRLSGWLLRRVDVVLLRDAVSMGIAAEVGARPPRVRQIPDTVFGLEPPTPNQVTAMRSRLGVQGVRFCAVSLKAAKLDFLDRIIEPLSRVLAGLLDAGTVDRVLVVIQTDGQGTSDRTTSERLVKACDDTRVELLLDDFSWRELTALYASAEVVVGGRVHSNILSLVGGTPAFPLDYISRKAEAIFDTVGMVDRVVRLHEQDSADVLHRITSVVGSERARREVAEVRDRLRTESHACRGLLPPPRTGRNPDTSPA